MSATTTQSWKVVQTWSFRGSKSRNKVSVGEPAEGSLMRTKGNSLGYYPEHSTLCLHYLCCFSRPALGPPAPAGQRLLENLKLLLIILSEYYIIVKTFNNGSLGSGIDEERSEMR